MIEFFRARQRAKGWRELRRVWGPKTLTGSVRQATDIGGWKFVRHGFGEVLLYRRKKGYRAHYEFVGRELTIHHALRRQQQILNREETRPVLHAKAESI